MKKKPKVTIVTHSGRFHSDDIFGVATLCLVLENDYEIEIVRSRDREIINTADYVVDTGDVYDQIKNRFDHHQQGGAGVRDNGIPYASFGLVWKKYGEQLSGNKKISEQFEGKIIFPIDARDNGIDITTPIRSDIIPFEFKTIIDAFKTTWKEDPDKLYDNFIFLVQFAREIIKRELKHLKDDEEGLIKVQEIYSHTQDKRLLIFETYYPYDENTITDTLFVIYPDLSGGNWCLETVAEKPNTYISRVLLPESWAGLRNSDLEKVTGVAGSIFCHNRRFLAITKTRESAIELAQIALREAGK